MSGRDEARAHGRPSARRPATKRGWLDARAWRDIGRAARLVREQGVSLVVHGVPIKPVLEMPHQEKMMMGKPCSQRQAEQEPAQPVPQRHCAEKNEPSKRQRRSAERLEKYNNKKKRAADIFAAWKGVLRALRRCYRAKRRSDVWTAWMRAEVERAPMIAPMEVGGRPKSPVRHSSHSHRGSSHQPRSASVASTSRRCS